MNNSNTCFSTSKKVAGSGIPMPKIIYLLIPVFIIFYACGSSYEEMKYREKSAAISDSISGYMPSLTTDTIDGIPHNFVRTAQIKCRVENVIQTGKQIEDLIAKHGGYISQGELSSDANHSNSIRFAKDSVMEISKNKMSNTIILKIPNRELDTVLRKISDMALYTDLRRVTCDDVKMKLYANLLAEKRFRTYKKEIARSVNIKSAKLNHAMQAENEIMQKQAVADEKNIDSYLLADQVNFSTVKIELYQPQQINQVPVYDPEELLPYSPGFFQKLNASFLNGLKSLEACLLFLVNCWGVLAFLLIVFFIIKKNKQFFTHRVTPQEK